LLTTRDIADALAKDRSKASVARQVERMHREPFDLSVFLQEIPEQELPVRWYLTWTLTHFLEDQPDIGKENVVLIWDLLKACNHNGMERDLWRSLTFVEIHEDLSGEVFDRAIQTLRSPKHAVAVRAHSMLVAFNIARPFEELRQELEECLSIVQQQNDSAGLYARSKNLRKKLARLAAR